VYVRFVDDRLGVLTIRDHKRHTKNRGAVTPKWNVIVGYRGKKLRDRRYFYNEHTILQCSLDLHSALTNNR